MGTLADYWAELQLMGDSSKKKKYTTPSRKILKLIKGGGRTPGAPKKGYTYLLVCVGTQMKGNFLPITNMQFIQVAFPLGSF